jgi:hypothetical protein
MADMPPGGNSVELFSLVSFLAVLIVGTTVGSRLLLLARRTRKLPELAIGIACLTMAVGGVLLSPIIYFSDSWPSWLIFAISIVSKLVFAVGASAICFASWQVFRPGRVWAASAWAMASLVMLGAVLVQAMRGDATTHWALLPENHVFWWVRIAAYSWTGFESLRYAAMMRRQARLGLGDPLAAAQIRLWGVASTAVAVMVALWAVAPQLGYTSVRDWPSGMFVANTLGLLAASSLHLAFLPPLAWRRWIQQRSVG